LSAFGCGLLAIAATVGAVLLFGNGFVGPAPLALGAAGGLIAAAVTLWRPPSIRAHSYPPLDRSSENDPTRQEK
jgi:hypothetical protein